MTIIYDYIAIKNVIKMLKKIRAFVEFKFN